jgi:hypothetical protein
MMNYLPKPTSKLNSKSHSKPSLWRTAPNPQFWGLFIVTLILAIPSSIAQTAPTAYQITVTSNQDGVQPDDRITLREAIELANGSLVYSQLSDLEKTQVKPSSSNTIGFNLSPGQTVISLKSSLPDVIKPVTIDGTGLRRKNSAL